MTKNILIILLFISLTGCTIFGPSGSISPTAYNGSGYTGNYENLSLKGKMYLRMGEKQIISNFRLQCKKDGSLTLNSYCGGLMGINAAANFDLKIIGERIFLTPHDRQEVELNPDSLYAAQPELFDFTFKEYTDLIFWRKLPGNNPGSIKTTDFDGRTVLTEYIYRDIAIKWRKYTSFPNTLFPKEIEISFKNFEILFQIKNLSSDK